MIFMKSAISLLKKYSLMILFLVFEIIISLLKGYHAIDYLMFIALTDLLWLLWMLRDVYKVYRQDNIQMAKQLSILALIWAIVSVLIIIM